MLKAIDRKKKNFSTKSLWWAITIASVTVAKWTFYFGLSSKFGKCVGDAIFRHYFHLNEYTIDQIPLRKLSGGLVF
jgi:hypothetical protein